MIDFFHNTLTLLLDTAPWLLLGLVAAGLIKAWIPQQALTRWMGDGFGSVIRAALVGAPLPLCSCGVVPAALGLRRSGASRGATISFLISTPETSVDSVAVSYALLGPLMAVVRPVAALASAIGTGALTAALVADKQDATTGNESTCCSKASCCPSEALEPLASQKPNAWKRSWSGIQYALTDIYEDIIVWLVIGVIAAGLVATLVPPDWLAQWGSGLAAMFLMLVVGIPMYICATASTPLAAALLMAGVSPGTVLVFLLAGPATNIGLLGIIFREMGKSTLIIYLLGISLSAIGCGLLLDWGLAMADMRIDVQVDSGHTLLPFWLSVISLIILFLPLLLMLRKKLNLI